MTDVILQVLITLADGADTVSGILNMLIDQYPMYADQVETSMSYAREVIERVQTDAYASGR